MTDKTYIEAAKNAIISILSNTAQITDNVPPEHIYDTDWAFRTANEFPGISVEEGRRLAGGFTTGQKELIIQFLITVYSENFEVSESRKQATQITNDVAEVLEKQANINLQGTVNDSEVIDINYNHEKAGASVKEVSWACQIMFNVQMMVLRG